MKTKHQIKKYLEDCQREEKVFEMAGNLPYANLMRLNVETLEKCLGNHNRTWIKGFLDASTDLAKVHAKNKEEVPHRCMVIVSDCLEWVLA